MSVRLGDRLGFCRTPLPQTNRQPDYHRDSDEFASGSSPKTPTRPYARHRGKIVTVVIEDTHLRVLHGEEEIAVRPRRNLKPIIRFHVTGAGANPESRQASHDDNPSRMS
jgi:hypothetical protein